MAARDTVRAPKRSAVQGTAAKAASIRRIADAAGHLGGIGPPAFRDFLASDASRSHAPTIRRLSRPRTDLRRLRAEHGLSEAPRRLRQPTLAGAWGPVLRLPGEVAACRRLPAHDHVRGAARRVGVRQAAPHLSAPDGRCGSETARGQRPRPTSAAGATGALFQRAADLGEDRADRRADGLDRGNDE